MFNIVIFFYVKYLVFYLVLMFKNKNYGLLEVRNLTTTEDWFYYLVLIFSMPTVSSILFTLPIHYSMKSHKVAIQVLVLVIVFVLEYFLYTYLASPSNFVNGIILTFLGIVIFIAFFGRNIQSVWP